VPEAERFEPPRGSWAEVSLVVVAVDDHRPLAVELDQGALVQLLRNVDRTREVLLTVLLRGKDFDELRALLGDQALNVVVIDCFRHRFIWM
jgi:hypothetical protein